jgi:hypothetical protein
LCTLEWVADRRVADRQVAESPAVVADTEDMVAVEPFEVHMKGKSAVEHRTVAVEDRLVGEDMTVVVEDTLEDCRQEFAGVEEDTQVVECNMD